jgi:hypothetical protein
MNQKDKVEWRRNKVQELLVKGYNHYEIASALQISRPTITRDIQYLSQYAKHSIKKYIDERLPEEYEKTLTGLTAILKEMWTASDKAGEDTKEKVLALSLAKEVYSMKLDLLSNVSTVEATMKFIADYKNNNNNNNSNNRTELQQKSLVTIQENATNDFSTTSDIEEETTTTTTTNKVF